MVARIHDRYARAQDHVRCTRLTQQESEALDAERAELAKAGRPLSRSELLRLIVRERYGLSEGPGVVKVTIVDMKRRAAP